MYYTGEISCCGNDPVQVMLFIMLLYPYVLEGKLLDYGTAATSAKLYMITFFVTALISLGFRHQVEYTLTGMLVTDLFTPNNNFTHSHSWSFSYSSKCLNHFFSLQGQFNCCTVVVQKYVFSLVCINRLEIM